MPKANQKGQKKQSGPKGPGRTVVQAPAAAGVKRQGVKVRERLVPGGRELTFTEYVQDIAGSVTFSAATFAVQPGVAQLFAWLSTQAIAYQEYQFRKLRFRFDTEKSSATSGKYMMAFLPDAADALPTSKQEMLENEEKAVCPVWNSAELLVKLTEALGRRRYIRSGALAANLDIKTYDVGQLVVATNGCADTSQIGELYVEYTIMLLTPVLSLATIARATTALVIGATPSQTSLFGTTPAVTGGLDATATVNTITFNRVGAYLVTGTAITGTGLFTSFVPVTSASTATVSTPGGISNAAANAGTVSMFSCVVTVTARGQTAVFDCTTVSTTIASSVVRVTAYAV